MKRYFLSIMALFCSLCVYAQTNQITIKTGEEIQYYPVGVEAIAFKSNTPLPVVSKIMKIDDKVFEFSLTVAALSNNTADGTYPILVSYYIKVGDELELNKNDTYLDTVLVKFKVVSVNWNTLVLQEKQSDNKDTAPKPSEDSL